MGSKKKVCVISAYAYIVNHINYGSLLQYFALEKALEDIGYSAYWLRFVLPKIKKKRGIKEIIKEIVLWRRNKSVKIILTSFQKFIADNLHVSEGVYSEDRLTDDCPKADVYITGSDQVWGGVLAPNYLTFVPDEKKKISYAASFGKSSISADHLREISPWLRRLNYISVREPSGLRICGKAGVSATLVADPTLLILGSRYPIDTNKANKYGEYYFSYFLNVTRQNSEKYISFLNEAEKKLGRVICVAGVSEIERNLSSKKYDYFTPQEWLGMYKEAQGILTNTFHGTVFAIIFRKKFVVYLQGGNTSKQNERILALLKTYGLEDRIFKDEKSFEGQMCKEINWKKVNEILKIQKESAFDYLSRALAGGCDG